MTSKRLSGAQLTRSNRGEDAAFGGSSQTRGCVRLRRRVTTHDWGPQGATLQPRVLSQMLGMPLNRSAGRSPKGGLFGVMGEFYPETSWYGPPRET